jgi:Spy/CpxP family protein refolding chaperone
MKSTKFFKLLTGLILSCSLLMAGPVLAERGQGHGKRGFNPDRMMEKMSAELGLSAQQQAQIKAIFESHKPQFEQLREQMKSTFTEEQRTAMKEMRKNRKGAGERPSKEDRQARFAELGVSEGQIQQMKALRGQMKAERQSIKNEISAVLTPEQQSKVEEWKAKHKGKRGFRGKRGQRGGETSQ